jgi:uncharacterized phiE125 gp8 family phage protein
MKSVNHGNNILEKITFSDKGDMPITILEAKEWLRRQGQGCEDDIVESLIEDVIDEMEVITNSSLVSQTITAVYETYGDTISLPYSPVSAITSVKTLYKGVETTLTASTDYYLQGDTLYMLNVGYTGLEVVYTSGGYFPNGLRNAVYQAILTNYNDREDNVLGGVTKVPNNSRRKALRYKRY